MLQLLAHLLGDYVFQNTWMANNKKKDSYACIAHCITYAIPFLFITNWISVAIIAVAHFAIDRTNIIARLIAIKNQVSHTDNFGYSNDTPFALSIWLFIITDNTIHLLLNYLIIASLG